MIKHKNLFLLGTSHIAKQSLKEVEDAIKNGKPDIVALELDRKRIAALFEKKRQKPRLRDIRRVGIKGFVFSIIGAWAEKKLGEKAGVKPGEEMKLAFRLAKEKNLKIALIDQDIEITLKKISKRLTWKEKWHFAADIFKAIALRKKQPALFDLRTVPSEKVIKKLTSEVKERYPNLYEVLVVERNEIMARNLADISQKCPDKKILAVIGAGHEKEILEIVKLAEEAEEKNSVTYSVTIGQTS